MPNSIELKFKKIKKEFLKFLKYTKGHADTTCCNYNSDLNIWITWLTEEELDWRKCKPTDVEHFVSYLSNTFQKITLVLMQSIEKILTTLLFINGLNVGITYKKIQSI